MIRGMIVQKIVVPNHHRDSGIREVFFQFLRMRWGGLSISNMTEDLLKCFDGPSGNVRNNSRKNRYEVLRCHYLDPGFISQLPSLGCFALG